MTFFRLSLLVLLSVFAFLASCQTTKVVFPDGMPVVSRAQWGANPPVLPMKEHVLTKITIHHTASRQTTKPLAEKLKNLQKFSQERSALADGRIKEPWADIPYHYYLTADGTIAEAREVQYVGDSNTPYDPTGHVLIVLEGNFNVEEVTPAQYQSLVRLTQACAQRWNISADQISGHRDNASSACPGDNLYALLPDLRKAVADNK